MNRIIAPSVNGFIARGMINAVEIISMIRSINVML